MPPSENRPFNALLTQADYCRMICLAALIVILGLDVTVLRAQEPVVDWKTTQQQSAALVSQCQFDQAIGVLSAFIKTNPKFAPAYEQRIWVVLDWLDLRDEFSLTDVPLRRRSFSDPATGLGNIDPPEEPRRIFLNDRWTENYVLPMEIKSVQQDLVECRRLAGKSFDERAIEAFLAEFTGNLDRAQELIGWPPGTAATSRG